MWLRYFAGHMAGIKSIHLRDKLKKKTFYYMNCPSQWQKYKKNRVKQM